MPSRRKQQPFKFRVTEEEYLEQYRETFDSPVQREGSLGIPKEPIPIRAEPPSQVDQNQSVDPTVGIPAEPTLGIPNERDTLSGIPNEAPGSTGIPNERVPWSVQIETKRLRVSRAQRVQDAHSRNEQALYDWLWRESQPMNDQTRERIVGYGELSKAVGLGRNTVIRAIDSLICKLTIERLENCGQRGSRYRSYGYSDILRRRESRGLVWVVKDRDGVALLRTEDLGSSPTPFSRQRPLPLGSVGIPNEGSTGIPNVRSTGIPNEGGGVPTEGIPGVPTEGIPGVPNEPPHPYSLISKDRYIRTNDDDDGAVEKLERLIRVPERGFDAAAVRQIFAYAHSVDPTVEPELIFEAFCAKRWELRQNPKVKNFNGLMKWNFDPSPDGGQYFTPTLVAELRRDAQRAAEQAQPAIEMLEQELPIPELTKPKEESVVPDTRTPEDIAKAVAAEQDEIAYITRKLEQDIMLPSARLAFKQALADCNKRLERLTQAKAQGAGK
jgi:hypothetical protein